MPEKAEGRHRGQRFSLKGFTVKDGRVIRDVRRLDVSAQIRQRTSRKIKVKRRGAP